jgi:dihydroorotase
MAEIGEMVEGGAVAISDDAFPLASSGLMRHVMEYCRMVGVPVILHCEDKSLAPDGLMNEGLTSTILGLRGIPDEVEEISVSRNILLARLTGCRTHIAHVSTKGAVEIIRRAKEDGIPVTYETCPQYFTLTEDEVKGYNTNAKVSPPLRTAEDVAAIKAGLADSTIDVIATDHAPHAIEEKEAEFAVAPSGMVGLETSLGLVMTELVAPGILSDVRAFEKMTAAPAKILGIPGGTLSVGAVADITVVDPACEWTVEPEKLKSKSKNTPFGGRKLRGRAALTILDGRIVCRDGKIVA